MNQDHAVKALSALAQTTRLSVYRLLVEQGAQGMPAGKIGERLEIPAATLSFHLKELEAGGLVASQRVSRQIFYRADYESMQNLIDFLMEDCCAAQDC